MTGPLSRAAQDVLAEREGQATREGWTPAHDDAHADGELSRAAATYALMDVHWDLRPGRLWPWCFSWFKPRTRRENLVRAGALILAEIERLDRVEGEATK